MGKSLPWAIDYRHNPHAGQPAMTPRPEPTLADRIDALARVVTDLVVEAGETEPSDAHTSADLDRAYEAAASLLENVQLLADVLRPEEHPA